MGRYLAILLLLPTLAVAGSPDALLARYEAALQKQDARALMEILHPDAQVRLLLEQPDGEPLALTLTRDEYLQQLRALWRFAGESHYEHGNVVISVDAQGHTARVSQEERYQLFGESLRRSSDTVIRMQRLEGAWVVMGLEALTREH